MIQQEFTRRRLLATTGAVAATVAFAGGRFVSAQDATPEESGIETQASPEASPTAAGPAVPPELEVETNWAVEGKDLSMTRLATGTEISGDTVSTLGLAWSEPVTTTAAFGALTANPIVAGDIVYIQDAASNVWALNKETGEQVWYHEYNDIVPSGGPNGIAVAYGMAYYTNGGVGDVVAVDSVTGVEVWRSNIQGPLSEGITMAPLVYDNTVYISTVPGSSEEFYLGGMRGVIYALDAWTGKVIWYFDTTTENLWGNARVNSGGGLWHPPSVDDEGNIYVGIANASPYPGTDEFPGASSRPGDNDYANALMRINPETAGYDWYINVKPHDLFDHDNQLSPILADVDVDGATVPMVFSSGKHGWLVAANQDTGEELWRTPVGDHNENEFLQELGADEEVEVAPGFLGGTETPMAYVDGVLYLPVINLPFMTTGAEGAPAGGNLFAGTSELVAVSAANGEILWSFEMETIANDIAFVGGLDGVVRGISIIDGTQVYTWQAAAGINTSYAISGDYLYVPAGGPLVPSADTVDPAPEAAPGIYALKLGVAEATPQATPAG
jgi:glucose dehydrogenase